MTITSAEQAVLADRLAARSQPEGECMLWTGCRVREGYGRIWFAGHTHYTHRAAWLAHSGSLTPGMLVLHSCDNPPCVNPAHLREGTPKDNMVDRAQRTGYDSLPPFPLGTDNPGSSGMLTEDDVRNIRKRVRGGESRAALGREFGVTRQTISDIAAGNLWKHVA